MITGARLHALRVFFALVSAAQRFALLALGRTAERRPIGKMIRRRKLLENAAESPASSARFVRRRFAFLSVNTAHPLNGKDRSPIALQGFL